MSILKRPQNAWENMFNSRSTDSTEDCQFRVLSEDCQNRMQSSHNSEKPPFSSTDSHLESDLVKSKLQYWQRDCQTSTKRLSQK